MEPDASKYCQSLSWKWESEYRRADSPTAMSSYSPVAIVKELNFYKGVTFDKCTWINTFSLLAQNPDIPEAKAAPLGSIFHIEGEKILNIEKNSEYWKIILQCGLSPLQPQKILLSSPLCLHLMTGLGSLLKLQDTCPGSQRRRRRRGFLNPTTFFKNLFRFNLIYIFLN